MTSFVNTILDTIDKKTAKEGYVISPENRVLKAKGGNELIPGGLAIGRDPAAVQPAPVAATGSGITAPLNESTTVARVYWADKLYTDSAGLLLYIVKPVKEITFNTSDSPVKPIKFTIKAPT